jgi:hypothetical protein
MAQSVANQTKAKVAGTVDAAKVKLDAVDGPSPNPMTNLILTDLLLRGGGRLMRQAVEGALLSTKYDKDKAKKIIAGRSMSQTLISTAVARLATRSVPGAILVGGGLLAKMLYDRRQGEHAAKRRGEKDIAKQAAKEAKV